MVSAFDDLVNSGSAASSAWATVQTQLSLEGADGTAVLAAKNTFADAWTSMTSSALGIDPTSAIGYAKNFTLASKTIAGSVATVEGLINAANNSSTPTEVAATFNLFAGTMVAAAVALGAVSAGVGAVIVAAVGIVASVLEGFLGSPPGVEVCPGVSCNPPPNWVVNCTCVWGKAYSPGAHGWRPFPTGKDWFTLGATATLVDGLTGEVNAAVDSTTRSFFATSPLYRPIDILFPNYASLEQTPPAVLADFHKAFFSAWKANQEYALNGQKAQSDAVVLQHTILVWNRAHASSSTTLLSRGTSMYEQTLVIDAISTASRAADAVDYVQGQSFVIYTGPRKVYVRPLHLTLPKGSATGATLTPGSSSTSSVGKSIAVVSLIVVGAGAAGLGVWAYATHQSYLGALKGVWRATGGKAIKAVNPLPSVAMETFASESSKSTVVQTLIFPRPRYSESRAKAWAGAHGYLAYKTDLKPNTVRIRQRAPSDFKKDSFRTITLGKSGVKAVIGHLR